MASVIKKCDHEEEQWARCSHKWTVRYREPGGKAAKQREKSFVKKRDADAFSNKVEHQKDEGTYINPQHGKRMVTKVFQEWSTGGDREAVTRDGYESIYRICVEPFWAGKSIGAVLPKDIDTWCDWMRTELKYVTSTAYNRYTVLSAMFGYAYNNRYIQFNPMKGAKGISRAKAKRETKAKIQIPTIQEIREIANAIRPEYRALVWVMSGCGLRIGEASALRAASIDFSAKTLEINRQVTRDNEPTEEEIALDGGSRLWVRNLKHKGEEFARTIPLPDFVSTELRRHLRDFEPWGEEGYLFPNLTRTNWLDRSAWARVILGEAVTEAGISRTVRGHWFRHYFASVCLAAGVPITDLATWLGHSSPQIVLDTYAHLMPDAPDRTRAAMDAALTGEAGGTLTVDLQTGETGSVTGGADVVLTLPLQRGVSAGQMALVASRE